jgi:uncharacterized membrane protein YagU involved in acid resistance
MPRREMTAPSDGPDDGVLYDVLKGAIAGAIATYVMSQATTWMYEREPKSAQDRENEARGGQTTYVNAAEKLAHSGGIRLSDSGKQTAGTAIHWMTGITAGVKYALARRYWPGVRGGFGVPYGMAVFAVMDEILPPLLGLAPGPNAFPWQTHARGFGGHLAFGATNDAALRLLDRVA